MARARNIKFGFFKNDDLAQCEYGARLMFIGLWCLADREGRLEDRPLRIKGELFPYDNCDISVWLAQLAEKQFITRYEVAGCKYIQVNKFKKHQNPHCKESASTIPAPCKPDANTSVAGLNPDSGFLIPDSSKPDSGARTVAASGRKKKRKAKAGVPDDYSPEFIRFWDVFPSLRKTKKAATWKAWQTAILRDHPETIITAAAEFADTPMAKGEFCPGPEPWLNNARWDDDRAAWQVGDGKTRAAPASRLMTADEEANWTPYGDGTT